MRLRYIPPVRVVKLDIIKPCEGLVPRASRGMNTNFYGAVVVKVSIIPCEGIGAGALPVRHPIISILSLDAKLSV